jgi:alkylation response protein AidB-like acyl-CoA dehydrogenase
MIELGFGFTDEQRMIRDTTLRMCKPFEQNRQAFDRAVREHGRVPDEFWTALADSGLLGAFVPRPTAVPRWVSPRSPSPPMPWRRAASATRCFS